MKRPKTLTKKERKAVMAVKTAVRAPLADAYSIRAMGIPDGDPILQQVLRALRQPAVRELLDEPQPNRCYVYAQTLYQSLDDTTGWEYALLLQNGDYHTYLVHGDTIADLAPDGRPDMRWVVRIPRAEHERMMTARGGNITYHATFASVSEAMNAAGFE